MDEQRSNFPITNSFQYLYEERYNIHNRRANSSVNDSPNSQTKHRAYNSTVLPEVPTTELQRILLEIKEREIQQMQREAAMDSFLPSDDNDSVLHSEDITFNCQNTAVDTNISTPFWKHLCCAILLKKCCFM